MDIIANLVLGFSVALSAWNLLFCFIGALAGTLIGVLPGIGPLATISLLLPTSYYLPPDTAIIMMAGVYFGSMYGGSTTSILVNLPGEAASVVTCIDGHQMALQGRGGAALGIAAFGSFIAGTLGLIALMLVAGPVSRFALKMGPPEYFSLLFCGLILTVYMAQGSLLKALVMAASGLFIATIGSDTFTGQSRFTFGALYLRGGIDIVTVVMGLFGIAEVLCNLERRLETQVVNRPLKSLLPTRQDWKESAAPILRGSILGFFLGVLPGGGPVLSSFASYALEKKLAKDPSRFGKGAIEGVAGPEAANNSCISGAFIPLLTLGIPSTAVMALILSVFIAQGLRPGPQLIATNPKFFWGVVTSMYIGNVMLLILNLPLIGLWVRVLKIPYRMLFPIILALCFVGTYSISYNVLDVVVMVLFGILGYVLRKCDYEPAPLVLALVICPLLEDSLRQSLVIFGGSISGFFSRPISAVFLGLAAVLFCSSVFGWSRRVRQELGSGS